MTFPNGHAVIDLMMAIPGESMAAGYRALRPLLRDAESLKSMEMPAHYLFRDLPKIGPQDNYGDFVVSMMDRFNIRRALVGLEEGPAGDDIRARHSERFLFETAANPHHGVDEIKRIRRLHQDLGLSAVSVFAAGLVPQVPINDKILYPIYATCCELAMPAFINVGIAGPRVPSAVQHVELLEELCWFFPDLKIVMRHGAEPWEELAVKLLLKWPNLYYSTSAFAPRHYPKAIIDYANTRGADKVLYAGYFPMGLSLDRIFTELGLVKQ